MDYNSVLMWERLWGEGRMPSLMNSIKSPIYRKRPSIISTINTNPIFSWQCLMNWIGYSIFFWRHMETSHPLHDPKKSQKYKDAIEDYYQHLDIAMKRFLDTLPEDTTVMIVSDHGFGGLHKDFYINKYFYDMDILSLKPKPPLSINTELLRAIKTTLKKLTYKMGVGRWVDRMIPDWLRLKSLTPTVDTGLGSVDWSQTKAYFCSLSGQNVWINLKGRQPEGIIEPGKEYEASGIR